MKAETEPTGVLMRRLLRLLRWRVWVQERLQPSEWQVTLMWAAIAGFLGALTFVVFMTLTEGVHAWYGDTNRGVVDSMRALPWWGVLLVPTLGGAAAGLVIKWGQR